MTEENMRFPDLDESELAREITAGEKVLGKSLTSSAKDSFEVATDMSNNICADWRPVVSTPSEGSTEV